MPRWRSIRFRLSIQYSAVVFGLGGALLGLGYLAQRQSLRSETMTRYALETRIVQIDGVDVVVPTLRQVEWRAIESLYSEIILDEVARFTLFALMALFLLSLVVGWVMSGRVLKPVEEITDVAKEIQASDLSRRIGLEGPDDELTRLASTFDEMLERLDNAFASQRRFLADTSHDLRTPLAVIRSNVEVVGSDDSATVEEWQEAGGIVLRNAEKMSEMINGLLAAARLQAGKAQAVTFDLAELVGAKALEYEKPAAERDVAVEASAAPVIVHGVEVSLDRAFSNLLDNAIAAAPSGSVVRVGSGLVDGWAWLGVEDRGPGLPDEPEGGRVGFGLSIVSQIVDAHDGVVESLQTEGGGTTMLIWLPTSEAESEHPDSTPFTNT